MLLVKAFAGGVRSLSISWVRDITPLYLGRPYQRTMDSFASNWIGGNFQSASIWIRAETQESSPTGMPKVRMIAQLESVDDRRIPAQFISNGP